MFVTNNSFLPVAEVEAKLARHGIAAHGQVVSSAGAAGSLLRAGERVLVCGGPGVIEAIDGTVVSRSPTTRRSTCSPVRRRHRHRDGRLPPGLRLRAHAARCDGVRGGARLLATNDDATYPTPLGPIPGAGSILAGIERASGVRAVVAGKPYRPMADLLRARLGTSGVVVGDRPDTDGRLARELGYRFALVLSGVTRREDVETVEPRPDTVADDLAALVATDVTEVADDTRTVPGPRGRITPQWRRTTFSSGISTPVCSSPR